jgi:adenylate kinase family enzyme
MKIFNNVDELKIEIVNFVNSNNIKIISFDGKNGSGKSTLAKSLCEDEGYIHLNLDDEEYLDNEKGTFIDYIKYDILDKKIKENMNNMKVTIIDGICILKILENLKIKSELKIYVKKLSWYGYWYDENYFDYEKKAEDIIQESENSIKQSMNYKAEKQNDPSLKYVFKKSIFHEIIEYHHEYKPDENADILYERFQEKK